MGTARITVTIPDEVYGEAMRFISEHNMKMSHLVSQALAEKLRADQAAAYVRDVNAAFSDPGVAAEQRQMAEAIADATDVAELPW